MSWTKSILPWPLSHLLGGAYCRIAVSRIFGGESVLTNGFKVLEVDPSSDRSVPLLTDAVVMALDIIRESDPIVHRRCLSQFSVIVGTPANAEPFYTFPIARAIAINLKSWNWDLDRQWNFHDLACEFVRAAAFQKLCGKRFWISERLRTRAFGIGLEQGLLFARKLPPQSGMVERHLTALRRFERGEAAFPKKRRP